MKEFKKPTMTVSKFDREDVVKTSGPAVRAAETWLTSEGVNENNVVKFVK